MGSTVIYLLDTNTCIQYLTGRSPAVMARFKRVRRVEIALCDVVKAELYYGANKSSRREANLALYERFFSQYVSLPFDGTAAIIYGRLRATLEAVGQPIGPYDLMIAAISLANNLILVTHNVDEFSRVEGLTIEDWEV
ncbi:putative virulence associated protein C (plasmid) [Crocosphaera subtropica ATCC 51142]|uniref:Ribonuclease VapC n=1 Tax=Crocosphaera subtropica (strain ATCC 51142 / BH68) TaxID=43989 RepID=B1X3D1_CROS5|nr:putative virulence associated protein C [Crocosphaera subtropica ATCC 51142]